MAPSTATATAAATAATTGSMHHVEEVMGMTVSIDIRAPHPSPEAVPDVVAWLHHVDAVFSPYKLDSEISRLGLGELALDRASDETRDVLRRCADLTERTDGVFDVFAVPSPNGTTLDPCGFVKGWSIETAAQMLLRSGATNFCLNAGGDIAVRGNPAPGQPWRIGIRHPEHADRQAAVIEGAGPMAVATSATYERGAHIVDPRSGQPVTEIASATVAGPDLSVADAYATVVFVTGLDGLDWIEEQAGYEAFVISHEATTHWTTDMERWLAPAEHAR